jgi:hypothetical protein
VSVPFTGKPLPAATTCFWKVKTWDNHGDESEFSQPKAFRTAAKLDSETTAYPLEVIEEKPTEVRTSGDGENKITFIDFGKAAFGQLKIALRSDIEDATALIHLGECLKNGKINRRPGGGRRYELVKLKLLRGTHTYTTALRKRRGPMQLPAHIGEVMPFRYCEIENAAYPPKKTDILRRSVYSPFDDSAASFESSDTVLNQVWELCKYSIKATTFTGMYIDGDRERLPYEADAYINQLGHYCTDREYTVARRTHEYLITHSSWPTEWILHSVLMAREDYLRTGNPASLRRFRNDLKAKTLLALKDESGFISTRTKKWTREVARSIYSRENLRDIVDWPHPGGFGARGETDGFVFTKYNTVVNVFHYAALSQMAEIEGALGNAAEQKFYAGEAARVKDLVNTLLFDKTKGVYTDGIETKHASLHANMLPLAFGIVPKEHAASVGAFVRSRGMECSVYGAQYLLDAVYENGDADHGLFLLTKKDGRSWYNMLREGSTITMEAWGDKYKPDQDWNHAWGAAPANIIIRKLMGVEPLDAGFALARIRPQTASLKHAKASVPTLRGTIKAEVKNDGENYTLRVEIPANMAAEIWLPAAPEKKKKLRLNGELVQARLSEDGKFVFVGRVLSGAHTATLSAQ